MPLSTEEILARRVRWQAYARSINGHRTSDEIMAEIRGFDAHARPDLQAESNALTKTTGVPEGLQLPLALPTIKKTL